MRNTLFTARYLKDILDYMSKYHLSSVVVNGQFKVSKDEERYYLSDLEYYKDEPAEYISSVDKKEFIYKFKNSSMYKKELFY